MYSITKKLKYGTLAFYTLAKNELGQDFQLSNEWISQITSSILQVNFNKLFFLKQTHSTDFFSTEELFGKNLGNLEGDSIFSQTLGNSLLVKTADCLPIALYSEVKPFYAIIHAGWRGLTSGIVEKLIEQALLFGIKPEELKILIAPYASSNYEVEIDVAFLFLKKSKKLVKQISEVKYKVDFLNYLYVCFSHNKWKIEIEDCGISTTSENEFFSHRKGDKERNLNILSIIKD